MRVIYNNNTYEFNDINIKYHYNDMYLNNKYIIEFYDGDKFVFEAAFDSKYVVHYIEKQIKYCDKQDTVKIDGVFNNKILLIDGYNLFSRAYKSFSYVKGIRNVDNALYGFFYYLRILDYSIRPDKIIIIFDGGGHSSYKESIYKFYKVTSNKMSKADFDDHKNNSFTRLLKVLDDQGIKYIKISNVEADDIISVITRYYLSYYNKVYIFSNDSDLYQLLAFDKNNVVIVRPLKGGIFIDIDYNKFYDMNNYVSDNIVYLKSLAGDKSDNIMPSCTKSHKYILNNLFIGRPAFDNIDQFLDFFKNKCKKVYENNFNIKTFEMNYKIISLQERCSYINEAVIDLMAKYSNAAKKSNIVFYIKYGYGIPDIEKFSF